MTDGADRAAAARLRGADRLAAGRRRPRQEADRDAARDRAAQEHADRVRLRQRLAAGPAPRDRRQVPPLRGVGAHPADPARPGRAGRQDRPRAGREHRLRPDAGRRRQREGRAHDGRRLAAADGPRPAQAARSGRSRSRRSIRCSEGNIPVNALGPPLQGRAHRPLHVRRLHGDRRAGAVRPPQGPLPADQRRRQTRPTRRSRRSWPRSSPSSTAARAARATSRREGRRRSWPPARSPGGGRAGVGGHARRAPRRALLRDHRAQGRAAGGDGGGLEHDRAEQVPGGLVERLRRRRPGPGAGRHRGRAERPAPLPDGLGHRQPGPRALLPRPAAAQGRDDPDPHRGRAGPDAVHRPRRQARQHLALAARAPRLRAGRPRRRRLRHAGLRADPRPEPDARASCARSAAGSTCRPAGATARASCATTSTSAPRAGKATIVQDELQNTYQLASAARAGRPAQAPPRQHRRQDEDGHRDHARDDRGSRHRQRDAVRARVGRDRRSCSRTGAATGTFRMLFPRGSVTGTVDMPFTIEGGEIDFRGTGSPHRAARAPTAASRAARWRLTTTTPSTGRTAWSA